MRYSLLCPQPNQIESLPVVNEASGILTVYSWAIEVNGIVKHALGILLKLQTSTKELE